MKFYYNQRIYHLMKQNAIKKRDLLAGLKILPDCFNVVFHEYISQLF